VRQARKTKDNSSYDELKLLRFLSESQFFELTFPSACRLDEREYSALVKTLPSFCQQCSRTQCAMYHWPIIACMWPVSLSHPANST